MKYLLHIALFFLLVYAQAQTPVRIIPAQILPDGTNKYLVSGAVNARWETGTQVATDLNYWKKLNSAVYVDNNSVGIGTSTPLAPLHVMLPGQGYWNFNSNTLSGLSPYPIFENINYGAYDSGFELKMRRTDGVSQTAAYFTVTGTGPWNQADLNTKGAAFAIATRKQGTDQVTNTVIWDGLGNMNLTAGPQTSNPNAYKLRVDGKGFFSDVLSVGDQYLTHKLNVTGDIGVNRSGYGSRQVAKLSNFGYSGGGYGYIEVGDRGLPVAFCDLSSNTSGAFSGTGKEVWFENGVNINTPGLSNTLIRHLIVLENGNVGINTGGGAINAKFQTSGSVRFTSLTDGILSTNASGDVSASNLTGDITSTGTVTTIAANAVTNSKIADGTIAPQKLQPGTANAVAGNYNTWGTEKCIRIDANAASRTVTVSDAMIEDINYIVRCTNNATNTVTFNIGTNVTGIALDQTNTLSLTSVVSGGASGTGVTAPFRIYTLTRYGSTVYIR